MNPTKLSRLQLELPNQLFFSPLAWLKLQFFCHAGESEIGGFGVSAKHNPLYVEDFVTVRQRVTPVSVHFDDAAVADHFDACVDRGLTPDRFARIWCHTHPGDSPAPSNTDEGTFARSFGGCDWAVMFIVARSGLTYARLAFSAGPGGHLLLPVGVDWASWPEVLVDRTGTLDDQIGQWQQEYQANVHEWADLLPLAAGRAQEEPAWNAGWWDFEPWNPALDATRFEPTPEKGLRHEPPF